MSGTYSMELAGRTLTVETNRLAELANANVLVRYGDTVVMVNVTASKEPREGIDFFPLSVDYEEKLYSIGKIPGGFQRRESRPSEKAILTSRVIDRPLRPLFPSDFRNDVVIVATVLSVDVDNSPEICAMIGSSLALAISDIPFGGPTGSINVGYVDGQLVMNPNVEQRAKSELNLTIAGTAENIAMIEAGANEIPDDLMLKAIKEGHEEIKKICEFISKIQKEIGKPKFAYKSFEISPELLKEMDEKFGSRIYTDIQSDNKEIREAKVGDIIEEMHKYCAEKFGEEKYSEIKQEVSEIGEELQKKAVRKMIYDEKKRPDGRKADEIRKLSCEVGLLPRTHGSAVFSRGQTQVLSIATLGMAKEEQMLEGLDEEDSKRYMHHYNFPGYSVGEAKTSRGPGRREIGHGALAERALAPVIPSEEEFPYAIRVVSEVVSSNGSTSQGSICGSTLALMDAGVPLKNPVAGISTGLITSNDNPDDYIMLTDIQGLEDFYGDMDFKVAGTKKGITAIQVDIKVDGLTYKIIEEAFEKTNKARQYILDEVMLKVIDKPRAELSKYAPKIVTMNINPDKIKDVIGSGGKVINKIIEDTGVKIDIEDTGKVFIYSQDTESSDKAVGIIEKIVREIEIGEIYEGTVVKIMAFGAFVDIGGGKEGLVHISKLAKERIEKVEDVVSEGDSIIVKVLDIDNQGKISLKKIGEQED